MKVEFKGKNDTFFSVYKLTLKPGINEIPDDVGAELLKAHLSACNRGAVKDEPKIVLVEEKTEKKSSSASSTSSVASAAKSILGGKGKDVASSKGEK